MDELELARYCDQIEQMGELAELPPAEGLTLDSLRFADFHANIDEVTREV